MELLRNEASRGLLTAVIPAKAGIQHPGKLCSWLLDPRFRGDDSGHGDDGVGRGFLPRAGG
jgi:hypothetical protein